MPELSLEEAREILKEEGTGYSDDELLELLRYFESIARAVVRNHKVLKSNANALANQV